MGLLWHAQVGCLTEMNCTPQNANVSLRVHTFPSEGLWEGFDWESARPVAAAQFECPATQRSGCVGVFVLSAKRARTGLPGCTAVSLLYRWSSLCHHPNKVSYWLS